ncbi:hypothetical protein CYMTET_12269 [Cymbomonas tetramitiformis]|uniref:Uncharacterized protein n=1 Tax=Cymbomonas tetramitiformis TaxID=36881 RepID=A0AAE0GKE3_9CHLO|nr:hypothetical protein CYMTET_12269 [Cymbomonas tetramitiformis]
MTSAATTQCSALPAVAQYDGEPLLSGAAAQQGALAAVGWRGSEPLVPATTVQRSALPAAVHRDGEPLELAGTTVTTQGGAPPSVVRRSIETLKLAAAAQLDDGLPMTTSIWCSAASLRPWLSTRAHLEWRASVTESWWDLRLRLSMCTILATAQRSSEPLMPPDAARLPSPILPLSLAAGFPPSGSNLPPVSRLSPRRGGESLMPAIAVRLSAFPTVTHRSEEEPVESTATSQQNTLPESYSS